LDELNIEIIRNTLYKAYLEDFYQFCQTLDGPTAEVMGDILRVKVQRVQRRSDTHHFIV
jgi:V-type H+-transporting ATPase subunit d